MGNTVVEATARLASPNMLVRLCVMLALLEGPSHGYHLIARIRTFGLDASAPGSVYHLLRKLEGGGLVRSTWDLPTGSGPARRVYELTDAGRDHLAASADDIQTCQQVFETFRVHHEDVEASAGGVSHSTGG